MPDLTYGFYDGQQVGGGDLDTAMDALVPISGVVQGAKSGLQVVVSQPPGRSVDVLPGYFWAAGRWFHQAARTTLALAAANGTNPQIHRAIVRRNDDTKVIQLAVIKGAAAVTPTAPALTNVGGTREWSLAQILDPAGANRIEPGVIGSITDERADLAVCGWAGPLRHATLHEPGGVDPVDARLFTLPGAHIFRTGSFGARVPDRVWSTIPMSTVRTGSTTPALQTSDTVMTTSRAGWWDFGMELSFLSGARGHYRSRIVHANGLGYGSVVGAGLCRGHMYVDGLGPAATDVACHNRIWLDAGAALRFEAWQSTGGGVDIEEGSHRWLDFCHT